MKQGKAKNSHDTVQYAMDGPILICMTSKIQMEDNQKYYDVKIK